MHPGAPSAKILTGGRMRTRILVLCVISLLAACDRGSANRDMTFAQSRALLSTGERITLRWYNLHGKLPGDERLGPITERLSELLNVDFVLEGSGAESRNAYDQLLSMLASGDIPDVFPVSSFGIWGSSPDAPRKYCARLEQRDIQHYMPEYFADVLRITDTSVPMAQEAWDLFRFEGELLALPQISTASRHPAGVLWRKDVLDELGFAPPDTVEEWEAVFGAYKGLRPDKQPYALISYGTLCPILFDATGLNLLGWAEEDGRVAPGWMRDEIAGVLATIADWRSRDFLREIRAFVPDTHPLFTNGVTIVTERVGYWGGSWVCHEPYHPGSIQERCSAKDSDARFIMGPYPRYEGVARPATQIQSSLLGNGWGFGRHLEDDRSTLRRAMAVVNSLAYDQEVFLTTHYGIERRDWLYERIDGTLFPESELDTAERQRMVNLGGYLTPVYSSLAEELLVHPRVRESRDELVRDPGALYSPERLARYMDLFQPLVQDAQEIQLAQRYYRDLLYRFYTSVVNHSVRLGESPEVLLDEYRVYWEENHGPELEAIVTRWYRELNRGD